MTEIWETVNSKIGDYEVSNHGRIRSPMRVDKSGHRRKEKYLSPYISKFGYVRINLYSNNKRKNYFLHRLIAETFLEKPIGDLQVNHKDGNKLNNNVDNLEWVTPSDNQKHAFEHGLNHPAYNNKTLSKRVLQYDKSGAFIKEYPSTKEVERQTGFNRSNIASCCRGRIKTSMGYIWKYA